MGILIILIYKKRLGFLKKMKTSWHGTQVNIAISSCNRMVPSAIKDIV